MASLGLFTAIVCPVCKSANHEYFITTKAMMHAPNSERYVFHKCLSCESVFLTNPVSEASLGFYYTDNYLPYRGAKAWGKYVTHLV